MPNKPLEWTGNHQPSASLPQLLCLPLRGSVGLSTAGKPQGQNGIVFLLKPKGEKGSNFHTIPLHIRKDCQEPQKADSRDLSICMQL